MLKPGVQVCPLRSGSSGNAVFVAGGSTRLLVDAGVCCRTIEQALASIGEDAARLNGLLITHEHTDHIAGAGVLMRRYKIPLYVNQATWKAMRPLIGPIDEDLLRLTDTGLTTQIGDLAVTPFAIPHDACEPVGYHILTPRGGVTVMTDVGQMSGGLLDQAAGSQIVLIEANYDHTMLMAGSYPFILKQRVSSNLGHLSNDDCARAIGELWRRGTRRFILSHLSKENNFPELAYQTVVNHLQTIGVRPEWDLQLGVARRFAVTEPACL